MNRLATDPRLEQLARDGLAQCRSGAQARDGARPPAVPRRPAPAPVLQPPRPARPPVELGRSVALCPVHCCRPHDGESTLLQRRPMCERHLGLLSLPMRQQLESAHRYGRDPQVIREAVKQARRQDPYWAPWRVVVATAKRPSHWHADQPKTRRIRCRTQHDALIAAIVWDRAPEHRVRVIDGGSGRSYAAAQLRVAAPWQVTGAGVEVFGQGLAPTVARWREDVRRRSAPRPWRMSARCGVTRVCLDEPAADALLERSQVEIRADADRQLVLAAVGARAKLEDLRHLPLPAKRIDTILAELVQGGWLRKHDKGLYTKRGDG